MAILDLIEYPDEYSDEIVHRFPETGSGEFRLGSQLVVRESQRVVFVRDGKALDVFGPGRHTLSTNNIPLLTGLIGVPFGGKSPFTAEVFFVSMREFTDMKWGTAQPMTYRDSELGMVRLRAFGTYSMRVAEPQLFVNQVVGSRGAYTTGAIDDFLKSVVITQFNDLLGDTQTTILDLPKLTLEMGTTLRNALGPDFQRLGLELTTFQITSITPPDEVLKRIDQRSSMGALGDLGAYTRFRTAEAIGDAANNPGTAGDVAATGVGFGAGIGIGQAMAGAVREAFAPPAPASPSSETANAVAGADTATCQNCQASIPAGAKYCPNCGTPRPTTVTCPNCQTANAPGAKFCTNCGTALATPTP